LGSPLAEVRRATLGGPKLADALKTVEPFRINTP